MRTHIGPDGRRRYRALVFGSSNAQFYYDQDGNPLPIDPKTGQPVPRTDPLPSPVGKPDEGR